MTAVANAGQRSHPIRTRHSQQMAGSYLLHIAPSITIWIQIALLGVEFLGSIRRSIRHFRTTSGKTLLNANSPKGDQAQGLGRTNDTDPRPTGFSSQLTPNGAKVGDWGRLQMIKGLVFVPSRQSPEICQTSSLSPSREEAVRCAHSAQCFAGGRR